MIIPCRAWFSCLNQVCKKYNDQHQEGRCGKANTKAGHEANQGIADDAMAFSLLEAESLFLSNCLRLGHLFCAPNPLCLLLMISKYP